MKAKSFMFVSVGILALAVAYNLGVNSVKAQGSGMPIAFQSQDIAYNIDFLTDTGEVWHVHRNDPGSPWIASFIYNWDQPIPTGDTNWSKVKSGFGK